ncbi:hypothetical protein F0562_011314 [Nyssa sinensis]|uniref:Acyl-ACP-thioesterase N-terminal domain-containing protein n=1 Tax=Nyssa sinensis TaxID=561372 RepID=A0A5J5A633_9ASTE|nr:hypothetical protein F0562_011314 [Nyssa sinensis]
MREKEVAVVGVEEGQVDPWTEDDFVEDSDCESRRAEELSTSVASLGCDANLVSASRFGGLHIFIMVATAAASSFFPVASPPPDSGAKTSSKLGGVPANVDARRIK